MLQQSTTALVQTIDVEYADLLLSSLKELAWTEYGPQRGMHCYGYSQDENNAIELVVKEAQSLGMESLQDLAGNVYLFKRGTDPTNAKTRLMVSHLDTVPCGGAHDGRDGIVGALSIVKAIKESKVEHQHDICIMIARSEESSVNKVFSLGAKLATGKLSIEQLEKIFDANGISIANKIESSVESFNQLKQSQATALIPIGSDASNLVESVLEMHIEQGEYCSKEGANACVVNAIRGNTRFHDCSINYSKSNNSKSNNSTLHPSKDKPANTFTFSHSLTYENIEIRGEAAHSGATFEEDRADAVRTAIAALNMAKAWCEERNQNDENKPCVKLVPLKLSTTNSSLTTIPDNAAVGFKIESDDPNLLSEFQESFNAWCKRCSFINPKIQFTGISGATTTKVSEPEKDSILRDRSEALEQYLDLMTGAEKWFQKQRQAKRDIVFTPSIVNTDSIQDPNDDPNNHQLSFSFEIRSTDNTVLQAFSDFIKSSVPKGSTTITLPAPVITNAVKMDSGLVSDLKWHKVSRRGAIGETFSGAGHDASTLADAGYPTVIIFIKQPDPISHNPEEAHDAASFKLACEMGLELIKKETRKPDPNVITQEKCLYDFLKSRGAR